MNILAAIRREERKLEKQLGRLQHQLNGVRAAAKALGSSAGKEVTAVKKRVLSAAGRAKIAKAAKKRWAKVRAQAKKAASATYPVSVNQELSPTSPTAQEQCCQPCGTNLSRSSDTGGGRCGYA